MQKLTTFITFTLLSVSLFSQDYTPFPDSNAIWKSSEDPYPPPPQIWYVAHWDYVILGDSIVNDLTYKKIGRIDYNVQCSQIYNGPYYVTLIRDDTLARKVYHWDDLYGETIMWDFTLQVGDSVPVGFNGGYGYEVASIDSVLCGDSYRKRFHYEGDALYPIEVVEGIGANTGLLEHMFVFEHIHWLRCFYQDGVPIYLNPEVDQCDLEIDTCLTVGIIEKSTNDLKVSVNPNPVSTWAAFNYEMISEGSIGYIKIINAAGKDIQQFRVTGKYGQVVWDTRWEKPGIYFYNFIADGLSKAGKIIVK